MAEMAKKYCMNFGYDGGVRALLCLLGFIWVFAACGGPTTEDDLRSRLEGSFESVLTGDAMSLNDYVSDSCAEKAEFLELGSTEPAFGTAWVARPGGGCLFGGARRDTRRRASAPPPRKQGRAHAAVETERGCGKGEKPIGPKGLH